MQQLPLGVRLRDRARFASFVAGPNAELLAHLERLAPGVRTAPTWLHGPAGTGKTHLLQAVCNAVGSRGRAGYFPLGDLVALGADALEGAGTLDCACLDGIDAVAGHPDWEFALFTLYRELEERGASLVIAARARPLALGWQLEDLRSRWAASVVFALRELDEKEQAEALRRHADARGLELPDETLQFLQRRYPRDTARLCEILDALDDASLAAQRRITVPFVREVLGAGTAGGGL
jgi:DnaA family protein